MTRGKSKSRETGTGAAATGGGGGSRPTSRGSAPSKPTPQPPSGGGGGTGGGGGSGGGTGNAPAGGLSGDVSRLMESASQYHNELYRQEQELHNADSRPWYTSNFFLSSPTLFGTWDGVFSSCIIHLFGVIVFLRAGWMVGNAGIGLSMVIVAVSVGICSVAALAGIFISQRCAHLEGRGTVHFLISHVLGAQSGGAISVAYCFGQAVSCALHAMGFAESVASILHMENDVWMERLIACILVAFLLVINLAGVKWVVRLQFLLLIVLLSALVDFTCGIFYQTDLDNGVLGLSYENLENNFKPKYETYKTNIFTVFGIFFPAVTGVMAGINMSGDIAKPNKDIPLGTFSAVGVATIIYLIFILGLGSTCDRHYLLKDMMISQRVSAIGLFLLAGLYMSSVSHCLGSLYTGPRIMQNMASENAIPVIKSLADGRGPNKVPTKSLLLFGLVTFAFIAIGRLNQLAPIVTIAYLFTYASVEYAYFSLAMTFDIQRERDVRFLASALSTSVSFDDGTKLKHDYGATKPSDLDRLFPERKTDRGGSGGGGETGDSSPAQYSSTLTSPNEDHSSVDSTQTGNTSPCDRSDAILPEIRDKPEVWYAHLENRWIAILAGILKIFIMFFVQWSYALSLILVVGFTHFYIGQVSPGAFPGISEFKMYPWLKNLLNRCLGKPTREYDHIVVTPARPNVEVQSALQTEEGADYSSRDKYHQSVTKDIEGKQPEIGNEGD